MNHGTCIHFSGIDMGPRYKDACCKVGINYFEIFDGRRIGMFLRMPCVEYREIPAHGRGTLIRTGEPTIRQDPTEEQVNAYLREQDQWYLKTTAALRVAAEWRANTKPEHDRSEIVECPVCKGKLNLFQSSRNGHTSGNCETNGCVSWME